MLNFFHIKLVFKNINVLFSNKVIINDCLYSVKWLLSVKSQLFQYESVPLQLVYHSLQLVAFALLAILIMRLKLFLTPHMCIVASLICSKQVRPSSQLNLFV